MGSRLLRVRSGGSLWVGIALVRDGFGAGKGFTVIVFVYRGLPGGSPFVPGSRQLGRLHEPRGV